jgi:hypothetical protein
MRYKVIESMLNEYTNFPVENTLGFVEAASHEEAAVVARSIYPNMTAIVVADKKPD